MQPQPPRWVVFLEALELVLTKMVQPLLVALKVGELKFLTASALVQLVFVPLFVQYLLPLDQTVSH